MAAAVSAALTVMNARKPARYTVTVAVLVSEGAVHAPGELGTGALRTHLTDLTFTRSRLLDLMSRHPDEFSLAAKNPEAAYAEIRDLMRVEISGNDFISQARESDAPRTARVAISFTGSNPQRTWQIAHDLADLMIDSTMARQRAALLREQAAAQSAVERAQVTTDESPAIDKRAVLGRLQATEARAAAARMGLRAADEGQSLRFELVDPGRVPKKASRASLIGDGIVTLAIALLVCGLLAGAFDPRVLVASDLTAIGIPLLGRLPVLPGAPTWPQAPQNAPDPSPPPSADQRPRV